MAHKKKEIYARYTGDGYIVGVPAIDLSKEEWFGLPEEKQKNALEAGTHKIVKASKKPIESAEEVNDG